MSDLKFNCPHCQQRLEVPEAAMGRRILCPLCQGPIRLPERKTPAESAANPQAGELKAISRIVQQQKDDIKFSCPKCDVHIVIAQRAAGKQITCQRCRELILVPVSNSAPSTPAATLPDPGPTPVPALVSASIPTPAPAPVPASIPTPAPPPRNVLAKVDRRQIADFVEKTRSGDRQAGRALLAMGDCVIPALIEGLRENSLEEPDPSKGASYVGDLLAEFGPESVPPLIAKLGKSRQAYLALAKTGEQDAINALVRELASVNWHRVELACTALGLVENPRILASLDMLIKLRNTTRWGEVHYAAGVAITAIQNRFHTATETKELKAVPLVKERAVRRNETVAFPLSAF